jgi:hypothetical protein
MVITLDVLPGFALLTEDSVPVIVLKRTNALDGIGLFIFQRDGIGDGAIQRRGVNRSSDRIRISGRMRCCEQGGICHNPTDDPLYLNR